MKEHDKPLIQACVLTENREDALLYGAVLNVHRGKHNVGELATFLRYLQQNFGWNNKTIAEKLHLGESYVSQLLTISENGEIVEKLKKA